MIRASSLLLAASILAGCSEKPDLANAKAYSTEVIELKYPGNWKQTAESKTIEGATIVTTTIESDDGSAQLLTFSPRVDIDTNEFAQEFLKGMDQELGTYTVGGLDLIKKVNGKKSSPKRKISGEEREGYRLDFTMSALGEKVPMRLEIYSFAGEKVTAVVVYYSPDEDLARDQPGYDLILDTLRLK